MGIYTLTNIQRAYWPSGDPFVEATFEGPGKISQRLNPAGYASLIGTLWGDQVVTVEQVAQTIIGGTKLELGVDVQDSSRPDGSGGYYREVSRFVTVDEAQRVKANRTASTPAPAPAPTPAAPPNLFQSPPTAPANPAPPPAPRAAAAPPPPPRMGGGGPTAPPPPPLRPR